MLALALGVTIRADADVHTGVVPGSYRLLAQDANGRQIEATAGNPGRIAGVLDCPVTLIGQAQVVATSSRGTQGLLVVANGTPPVVQSPRPQVGNHPTPATYRFDVLVERRVDRPLAKSQAAEFDVRYLQDHATHVFRWPVVLDLECVPTERRAR